MVEVVVVPDGDDDKEIEEVKDEIEEVKDEIEEVKDEIEEVQESIEEAVTIDKLVVDRLDRIEAKLDTFLVNSTSEPEPVVIPVPVSEPEPIEEEDSTIVVQ